MLGVHTPCALCFLGLITVSPDPAPEKQLKSIGWIYNYSLQCSRSPDNILMHIFSHLPIISLLLQTPLGQFCSILHKSKTYHYLPLGGTAWLWWDTPLFPGKKVGICSVNSWVLSCCCKITKLLTHLLALTNSAPLSSLCHDNPVRINGACYFWNTFFIDINIHMTCDRM